MTSNITSFITPKLQVQIPVAFSPSDALLMMIGATLGGAAPVGNFVLVGSGADLVLDGGGNNVIYS